MTRNGICPDVNKEDGSRIHTMTTKTDGQGRTYESCERCGTTFVKLPETTQKKSHDD